MKEPHKEYHPILLGVTVYYGYEKGAAHYWRDMLTAVALRLREQPGLRQDAGASTAAVWLTRWALDHLPAELRAEVAAKYIIVRENAAVERARKDDPEAPRLDAFGHTPAS